MNQLNSLILEGNLEGSVKYSEGDSGIGQASFSISVRRFYKSKDGDNTEEVLEWLKNLRKAKKKDISKFAFGSIYGK